MQLFDDYVVGERPKDLVEGDCLVVWGGADISPSLYNKAVGQATGADDRPSFRDAAEWELMKAAKEKKIPIIGICRGAQMLCALAGGFLIQDVTNHTRQHAVTTKEGNKFIVSSLHHQMLYPFDVEHEMIAHTSYPLSNHYLDVDTDVPMPLEPEFVWFPKELGMAIQWHPEFMDVNTHANVYVKNKIKELILNETN
jgi:putative glutamine amidotransferase